MINGLLAKPTHGNIVRFSPPLIISMCQMEQGLNIIKKCLLDIKIEEKKL